MKESQTHNMNWRASRQQCIQWGFEAVGISLQTFTNLTKNLLCGI